MWTKFRVEPRESSILGTYIAEALDGKFYHSNYKRKAGYLVLRSRESCDHKERRVF